MLGLSHATFVNAEWYRLVFSQPFSPQLLEFPFKTCRIRKTLQRSIFIFQIYTIYSWMFPLRRPFYLYLYPQA